MIHICEKRAKLTASTPYIVLDSGSAGNGRSSKPDIMGLINSNNSLRHRYRLTHPKSARLPYRPCPRRQFGHRQDSGSPGNRATNGVAGFS